jgi:hypothetical protein
MHENATLHFDLSHLSPDQPFTLHAGSRRYELARHTRHTLAGARRSNAALAIIPGHRVTHFAGPVRLPAAAPLLLRVTAPKRDPDDLLDRLVLTSVRLPRRHRAAGLARRRSQRGGSPLRLPPKLVTYGLVGVGDTPDGLLPDKVLIDIHDMQTADDAAYTIVFHHPELLTLHATPADQIMNYVETARGIEDLAQAILDQSQSHDKDPSQPNWAVSKAGKDWRSDQPAGAVYAWSGKTLEYLSQPLGDTLQATKDDTQLEKQCWTVQPGKTQVSMTTAPVATAATGEAAATYTVKELTPQSGVEHYFKYDPGTKTATVSLKNYYLRWLTVSVDQYGPGGEQVGSTQVLGHQSPVDTIMAVPLDPDCSDFQFTFDDRASRAVVSLGGLGQVPFSWPYDGVGISLTALFNYAIPTAFLAFGKTVDDSSEWSELERSVAGKALAVLEAASEGPIASAVGTGSAQLTDVLYAVANCAASLLVGVITSTGCEALKEYITEKLGEAAAEEAAPFLGWVATAIGAAADVASMVETSVEVARSPATMSLDIERTMNVEVTVTGDEAHQHHLPETATYYLISITYDDGPVYNYAAQMTGTTQTEVTHTFADLPAGGNITVLASFFSKTGWLAGHGVSPSTQALPDSDGMLVVKEFAVTENKVPLTATTTYTLKEKIGFQGGSRVWIASPPASPPTATVSDLDSGNVGDNLQYLGQLTLNEAESELGYSWQASGQCLPLGPSGPDNQRYPGQMFSYQAVSDGDVPESGLRFPGYGTGTMPCLAFPPPTMANPVADGFLLEPDDSGKSMLLRAVSLQPGQPMISSPGHSFGRFTFPQDDLAVHPAGYAVALNTSTCKLQIARLTALTADASAPAAAILAGQGNRAGLLNNPVAVSCSQDRIVVLQSSDPDHYPQGCMCAFDVKGNPVNCFAGSASSVARLHPEGTAQVQLVDLSVEPTGYLYVLKYLVNSSSGQVHASDYRLDIYNPDGTLLVQVPGIAAARLHVDLWRDMYTLNYEILQGSGRTEPSVAEWIPSTPGT